MLPELDMSEDLMDAWIDYVKSYDNRVCFVGRVRAGHVGHESGAKDVLFPLTCSMP